MLDLTESYLVTGQISDGKEKFVDALSKKTGMPVISIEKLKDLPNISELQLLKFNQNYEKYSLEELDFFIDIRQKCGDKLSFEDFGYSKENFNKISEYGGNFGKIYSKQFEKLVIENLTQKLDGKYIIKTTDDFPINYDSELENFKNTIIEREGENNPFIVDESKLKYESTKNLANQFVKRIYVELTSDQSKWFGSSKTFEKENLFLKSRDKDFENLSNFTLGHGNAFSDAKNFDGKVSDKEINSAVDYISDLKAQEMDVGGKKMKFYGGLQTTIPAINKDKIKLTKNVVQNEQNQQNEKIEEKQKKEGFFKKLGKFLKAITGISLIEKIAQKLRRKNHPEIYDINPYMEDTRVEKITQDELDEAKNENNSSDFEEENSAENTNENSDTKENSDTNENDGAKANDEENKSEEQEREL